MALCIGIMHNLLNFLFRYGYCFLFILLEFVCFLLLFRFNNYQSSIGFTSANEIVGGVYNISSRISSFFSLSTANKQLTLRNIELETENLVLREKLKLTCPDSLINGSDSFLEYQGYGIIPARVINNSINAHDNYITLDKGSFDGISPEMGVVNGNGIVGIVYMVSDHYSLVISLLNKKASISCKFKHSDYFGYLRWKNDEPRYAYLEDLPRHAQFQEGDTIVTSGYSAVFPKGLLVGTVDNVADSEDGHSYLLRIRLATDFSCLDKVVVMRNMNYAEQRELESQIR